MAVSSGEDTSPDRRAITAVLDAVARDAHLHAEYVLKGGLALQLAYGSPRRSDDLDFNAVRPTSNDITTDTKQRLFDFAERLDAALSHVAAEHAFGAISTARQLLSKEIPTLMTDVGYTTTTGESGHVKLQLTLSEIVCATTDCSANGVPIHAASLEDILAEKLKALLQQITRDKVRSSDVFDVWYFTNEADASVDTTAITEYLIEKKKHWRSIPPLRKGQFRRKSVVQKSAEEYSALRGLLPPSFELIPFRDAYACVLRFVDGLELPD